MKTAVFGVGAIGGICLASLWENKQDVVAVARGYQVEALKEQGLLIDGFGGKRQARGFFVDTKLTGPVDLAIFAVKTNDLKEVALANKKYLENAIVLTSQNGISADYVLADIFGREKVITGIVMFGATFTGPNFLIQNFPGQYLLGSLFDQPLEEKVADIAKLFTDKIDVVYSQRIKAQKHLKLFVNLTNCVPACLGKSMQEVFSDLDIARLAVSLISEAYGVVKGAGIDLVDLPTYPVSRVVSFSKSDEQTAKIFSQIMLKLSDTPVYGSILQSIQRGKLSEIDYINGEIVRIAKDSKQPAPLNEKMVSAVHQVEKTKKFFSKEELLAILT